LPVWKAKEAQTVPTLAMAPCSRRKREFLAANWANQRLASALGQAAKAVAAAATALQHCVR
jgi:hypothetical protein